MSRKTKIVKTTKLLGLYIAVEFPDDNSRW